MRVSIQGYSNVLLGRRTLKRYGKLGLGLFVPFFNSEKLRSYKMKIWVKIIKNNQKNACILKLIEL